ncbi:MAG: NADH dehydrogenase (quinone) subunit D [Verrucomicrobiales bacterium]|jgi:NADH-quinone oxidoreductase subunit D|nr:NADH dehydrogenase (quinone) subunit D [Verrucomicrobiales bacterium]
MTTSSANLNETYAARFAGKIEFAADFRGETTWTVAADAVLDVLGALRAEGFDYLVDLSSVDHGADGNGLRFEVVYELQALATARYLRVRTRVADGDAVPSVSGIWRTANWHEREIYDMMGVRFSGHPDLRRILMWEGYPYHPLRKEFPLAGKATELPDIAFTAPAPLEGGPFVTAPTGEVRSREPRSRENSNLKSQISKLEIKIGDAASRSAAAVDQAALDDAVGEKLVLNMGPSHPSTHGVLRIVLELDGEVIVSADPDVGYLHRGDEKIAENMTWHQFIPYTDRLDYLSPLANNVAYACAVEKLMGYELPERAQVIRVICCELARISSHLVGIGCCAMDIGAMTVFLYTFTEREKLYNLFELLTGARFTTSYTRIGGVARDLPDGFIDNLRLFLKQFPKMIDEVERLLNRNPIFLARMKDIGVISAADAVNYGLSGPNLRGSGVEFDLRKKVPYLGYEQYDFDVPVGEFGDSYDRYLIRVEELKQSLRIIEQAIGKLRPGPVMVSDPKNILPPKDRVLTEMEPLIQQFMIVTQGLDAVPGEVYFGAENPKGELGFYINSRGGGVPYRMKIRSPSFVNLGILPRLLPGLTVSDVPAVLGSFDFVMGECDR